MIAISKNSIKENNEKGGKPPSLSALLNNACYITGGWAAKERRGPNFPLYHTLGILSSDFLKKVAQKIIPNFVQLFT
jgi:hypothetical protein